MNYAQDRLPFNERTDQNSIGINFEQTLCYPTFQLPLAFHVTGAESSHHI